MEKIFEVKDGENVIEGVAVSPNSEVLTEATIVYNRELKRALASGNLLAAAFSKYLIEQGLWTEEKERRLTILNLTIRKFEKKLKNKNQPESEARESAKELRKLRNELNELITEQSRYTDNTAEGIADNARFNFLCVKCILDKNSRKPYYSSVEDFVNKSNTEYTSVAVGALSSILYGVDSDFREKYPEEIFFKRFKEDEVELTDEQQEIKDLLEEVVKETEEEDMNSIVYQ
jgi:hypothetical protein